MKVVGNDMDKPREPLPPSPPMTVSSTKSSPPSHLPLVSPGGESPPLSPRSERRLHSASPRHTSPLPPLPPEVFLTIVDFLPPQDQRRIGLVSRSWYSFVTSEPKYWSHITSRLERDETGLVEQAVSRAVGNGNKKRGGLRSLRLIHRGGFDRNSGQWYSAAALDSVLARFNEVLTYAQFASIPHSPDNVVQVQPRSTLEQLSLQFSANHLDTLYLLHELAKDARIPLFASLQHFDLQVGTPLLQLRDAFLFLFPHLRSLNITAKRHSVERHLFDTTRWYFGCNAEAYVGPPTLDHLESLKIVGAVLCDSLILPDAVPALTRITLSDVRWEGKALFLLLRLARHTLEYLTLVDFVLDRAHNEVRDWEQTVDIREPLLTDGYTIETDPNGFDDQFGRPAPIVFPRLRILSLSGLTPPLFSSLEYYDSDPAEDDDFLPTPIFSMPNLVEVTFDGLMLDQESFEEDETLCALPTFGRNAPLVERFALPTCNLTDTAVFSCLAGMAGRITYLDFYDTIVSDALLARLPHLVPRLKSIDLRSCVEVTCQGAARMVEVIRHLHDDGIYRVEEVMIDQPEWSENDWRAYRWMDFIGVLKRDEQDFEGLGPVDHVTEKKEWIREGKKDRQWKYKEEMRRKELEMLREAAVKALEARKGGFVAGGSGSGGGSAALPFTGANALSLGTHGVTPLMSRPPLHQNYYINFAQSTPIAPFPPIPQRHPSQQQLPTAPQQLPLQLPSVLQQPPPLVEATPARPPQQPSKESQLDIRSLDAMDDFSQLDPALIREQQLMFEQLARQQQGAHDRTERRLSQEEAFAVAEKQQHERMSSEAQQFVQDSTTAAIASGLVEALNSSDGTNGEQQTRRPGGLLVPDQVPLQPATDARMAHLADVRKGGGNLETNEEGRAKYGHFADDPDEADEEGEEDMLEYGDDEAYGTEQLLKG